MCRAGSNQSFLPVSAFVQGLIKDDGLRGEAVTSGLLSICAQVRPYMHICLLA